MTKYVFVTAVFLSATARAVELSPDQFVIPVEITEPRSLCVNHGLCPKPQQTEPKGKSCKSDPLKDFFAFEEQEPALTYAHAEIAQGTTVLHAVASDVSAACINMVQQPTFASYLYAACPELNPREVMRLEDPADQTEKTRPTKAPITKPSARPVPTKSPPCLSRQHHIFAVNAFHDVMDCMKSLEGEQNAQEIADLKKQWSDEGECQGSKQECRQQVEERAQLLERTVKRQAIRALKPQHLIPMFAQESGFHLNAYSGDAAGGFGQLTLSAISEVNEKYRQRYWTRLKASSTQSCQRLAPVMKEDFPKPVDERCYTMLPLNRAVQNMFYGAIYFEENRKLNMKFFEELKGRREEALDRMREVRANLEELAAKAKGKKAKRFAEDRKYLDKRISDLQLKHRQAAGWTYADRVALSRRLAYLAYNSGPGTESTLTLKYLDDTLKEDIDLVAWLRGRPLGQESGQVPQFVPGIFDKGKKLNEDLRALQESSEPSGLSKEQRKETYKCAEF